MNTRENNFLVPYISASRNYWLVRTEGGTYYNSFRANGYVGISWNDLDFDFFNQNVYQQSKSIITGEDVKNLYEQKFFDNEERLEYYSKNATRISTMINRFAFGMKKGDIVLIPSSSSKTISFGEVLDDDIYFEGNLPVNPPQDDKESTYCPFVKRKSVRWLKDVKKHELDSNLYTLLYSQHTVNLINSKKYGHYIDRTLDSIYIKGNKAHLVLNVKQTDDINALSFADIIKDSIKIVNEFNYEYPNVKSINGNKIKIKANVQSPGPMELFGSVKEVLLLTSIVIDIFGIQTNTFKIISFWKKENSDEILEALEILESEEFQEYKKNKLPQKSTANDLRGNLDELGVETPTADVNSTQNIERHEGVIDYERTS